MSEESLNYDMSHLTLQQIDYLHVLKILCTKRMGKLGLQRMKSEATAEWLRICE